MELNLKSSRLCPNVAQAQQECSRHLDLNEEKSQPVPKSSKRAGNQLELNLKSSRLYPNKVDRRDKPRQIQSIITTKMKEYN